MYPPHRILGISAKATPDEIKAAFRRLAKKYHPDFHKGDHNAAARFREINVAYLSMINDGTQESPSQKSATPPPRSRPAQDTPKKKNTSRKKLRQKTDTHPPGNESASQSTRPPRRDNTHTTKECPPPEMSDPVKTFSGFFSSLKQVGKRAFERPGKDHHFTLAIPFQESLRGTFRRVTLPNGKTLDVKIPEEITDGTRIRLRGQGEKGSRGAGDIYITIEVTPDPRFQCEGQDVISYVPVSLRTAVLGGRIEVETLTGTLFVYVPAGSSSGRRLRLREQGLSDAQGKKGDHYAVLLITLPDRPDPALHDFVASWSPGEKTKTAGAKN